jgi:hypothetical protein
MDTAALSLQNLPQIMSKPRNIILIVADSLRYDSVYGAGETQSVLHTLLKQQRCTVCTSPLKRLLDFARNGLTIYRFNATSARRNQPNAQRKSKRANTCPAFKSCW